MATVVDRVATGKAETKAEARAKRAREPYQENFRSAEEAVKAAEARVKGPRRAFKTSYQGKEFFVVAHNEGRAGGVAFMNLGGQVEELGKAKRAKLTNMVSILATIKAMPEAERAATIAQLKALSIE